MIGPIFDAEFNGTDTVGFEIFLTHLKYFMLVIWVGVKKEMRLYANATTISTYQTLQDALESVTSTIRTFEPKME